MAEEQGGNQGGQGTQTPTTPTTPTTTTEESNVTEITISDDTLSDYKKAATKWQKEFLEIPMREANDVLQYFRPVYGLRGDMMLPSVEASSEFGPYDPDRVSKADIDYNFRKLTTYFGSDIVKFHPNDYALMIMGYDDPTLGDALKDASTSALVIAQIQRARGAAIANAVINGVRDATKTKTIDLLDGIETIIKKEVTATNISTTKGNMYEMTAVPSDSNAEDIAKAVLFNLDPQHRKQDNLFFCSQSFADKYNEAYLATHTAAVYNTQYNQVYVEGSNKKMTLVPLPELEGADYFWVTPKKNMLFGCDNRSKMSTVQIDRFESFRLTLSATCFLGVQLHSINKALFKAVKVKKS